MRQRRKEEKKKEGREREGRERRQKDWEHQRLFYTFVFESRGEWDKFVKVTIGKRQNVK